MNPAASKWSSKASLFSFSLRSLRARSLISVLQRALSPPWFVDFLRYDDLPEDCGGEFAFEGEVGNKSLSGRHCMGGRTLTVNNLGVRSDFELPGGGMVMLWAFIAVGSRSTWYSLT